MTKTSVKKLSILGLVLMAASAVTAAIIPSNSNKNKKVHMGNCVSPDPDDNGGLGAVTCTGVGSACDVTHTGEGATSVNDQSNNVPTTDC